MKNQYIRKFLILGISFVGFVFISKGTAAEVRRNSASGPLGVGFFLGNPTSLTVKYFMAKDTAIDGGLAFAFSDYFLIYSDYLIHYPGLFGHPNQFVSQLVPYVGIGGLLAINNRERKDNNGYVGKNSGALGLGIRVPFGIEWRAPRPPLGVYVEIAPGISIIPDTSALFAGGIGIRYYF